MKRLLAAFARLRIAPASMRQVVVTTLAFLLLLSGVLSPSVEAASAASLTSSSCASTTTKRSCCCSRPRRPACACDVAPRAPLSQPIERTSVSWNTERVVVTPPSYLVAPTPRVSPLVVARSGRRLAPPAHVRLHLLERVFRE